MSFGSSVIADHSSKEWYLDDKGMSICYRFDYSYGIQQDKSGFGV